MTGTALFHSQAPSFRLASYISSLHKPAVTSDPNLASSLHEAHAALQVAASAAAQQLQQLQEIKEQVTDAALAMQLEIGAPQKGCCLCAVLDAAKHAQPSSSM